LELIDDAQYPALAGSLHDRLAQAYQALRRPEDVDREIAAASAAFAAVDPALAETSGASIRAEALLNAGRHREAAALQERYFLPVCELLGLLGV
jgi:hypothetical protein